MATDADASATSLETAVAALFNLGQAGIDWTAVARAILAFREERRQEWLDAHDALSDKPRKVVEDPALALRKAEAGSDAAALAIEVNAAMVGSLMRMSHDWQRLLEQMAPRLKRAADDYNAEADPAPQILDALVNELVDFTEEVGVFLRDQGAQLERDLRTLRDEILGRHEDDSAVPRLRRRKG